MKGNAAPSEERLIDLLSNHATEGLDMTIARDLNELLGAQPDYKASHFESAAAAIDLAWAPPSMESITGALRDRILADAGAFFATRGTQAAAQAGAEFGFTKPVGTKHRSGGRAAWYLAAASLALAVVAWWQVLANTNPSDIDVSKQYADFVDDTADLTRVAWVGRESGFEEVSGEAVWSDAEQRGYMRLVGLPANDPKNAQYQLWIVDPHRDDNPIDGGVFDVRTSGKAIIRINAKLPVENPRLFAITCERPGGVVVSAGPLLVVGAVPS